MLSFFLQRGLEGWDRWANGMNERLASGDGRGRGDEILERLNVNFSLRRHMLQLFPFKFNHWVLQECQGSKESTVDIGYSVTGFLGAIFLSFA